MALHILAGLVLCGGVLVFLPAMRYLRHVSLMHHALTSTPDPLVIPMAARMFAHEVDELLARHQRTTGATLHIHTDSDGGTHYDMAPVDAQGTPQMRRSVAFFHRVPLNESTQPSVPAIPTVRPCVRSGSFGRTLTAIDYSPRITRVLPALNDEMEAL